MQNTIKEHYKKCRKQPNPKCFKQSEGLSLTSRTLGCTDILCEKHICDWWAYSHHSEKVWDVYYLYYIHILIVKQWSKYPLDLTQEELKFGDKVYFYCLNCTY